MSIVVLVVAITVSFGAGYGLASAAYMRLLRAGVRDGVNIVKLALDAIPPEHPKTARLKEVLRNLTAQPSHPDKTGRGR